MQCQGKHVRAAALCSDSSSDVLISTASLTRYTHHLLTSLSWRMRASERKREREGCESEHERMFPPPHPPAPPSPLAGFVLSYSRVCGSILVRDELDSAG